MIDLRERTHLDESSETSGPSLVNSRPINPTPINPTPDSPPRRLSSRMMWGIGPTVIGALALLASATSAPIAALAILPTLAGVFVISGIHMRSPHLLVAAGILGGLGVGTVLAYTLDGRMAPDAIGGLVILCLGMGFVMTVALQLLVTRAIHWWPFVSAGVLVLIGLALLMGGSKSPILQVLDYLWPVVVLALGLWLLLRAWREGSTDRSRDASHPR